MNEQPGAASRAVAITAVLRLNIPRSMSRPHSKLAAAAGKAALLIALALGRSASGQPVAATAPGAITDPVPRELLARAASPDPLQRMDALPDLVALRTPAGWDLMTVMLHRDVDVRVRRAAALALGASHDP